MPRLTTPNGVVVSVSDEKAPGLLATGYKAADEAKKAPAKKTAASRSKSD